MIAMSTQTTPDVPTAAPRTTGWEESFAAALADPQGHALVEAIHRRLQLKAAARPPLAEADPEYARGYGRGYADATASATAAHGTSSSNYRLYVDIHTGWVPINEENALLMLGRGHRVERRLVTPWEAVTRIPED